MTASIPVYTYEQLMKEHDEHEALIDSIKAQICQENLEENQVPLFIQLQTS